MAVESCMSPSPAASEKEAKALAFIKEMTRNADAVQEKVLAEILSQNAQAEYLQRYGMDGATDRETFKSKIPVVTYEDPEPYIQRIANGDRSSILSGHPISEFLASSGTSAGERKLIPTIPEEMDRRQLLYSLLMPVMNQGSCSSGTQSEEEMDLRRGPWTMEEDLTLVNYIANHGEGRWNSHARCTGLKRAGKSCRLRWLKYFRPDVRRGNITPEEQLLILELHSRWGNRWSKIAQHLPGRTDNVIKNYWRTWVQKHAKKLKFDVNRFDLKDDFEVWELPESAEVMPESEKAGIEMFRSEDQIMGIQGLIQSSSDLGHVAKASLEANEPDQEDSEYVKQKEKRKKNNISTSTSTATFFFFLILISGAIEAAARPLEGERSSFQKAPITPSAASPCSHSFPGSGDCPHQAQRPREPIEVMTRPREGERSPLQSLQKAPVPPATASPCSNSSPGSGDCLHRIQCPPTRLP